MHRAAAAGDDGAGALWLLGRRRRRREAAAGDEQVVQERAASSAGACAHVAAAGGGQGTLVGFRLLLNCRSVSEMREAAVMDARRGGACTIGGMKGETLSRRAAKRRFEEICEGVKTALLSFAASGTPASAKSLPVGSRRSAATAATCPQSQRNATALLIQYQDASGATASSTCSHGGARISVAAEPLRAPPPPLRDPTDSCRFPLRAPSSSARSS